MSWIAKNNYLSESEMKNNATMFCAKMTSLGFSLNAICGMLGNIQTESNINPGIWESLTYNLSRGYGLVQWTPATKYIKWCGSNWKNNGDKQCERINYECENGLQWFSNPKAPIVKPPISFKEFKQSTLPVETLANYFLWYYEHPYITIQPNRSKQALKWADFFGGVVPSVPSGNPTKNKNKMPIYMMIKNKGVI